MSEDTSEFSINPSENGIGKEKRQGVADLEDKIDKLISSIESREIKDNQELGNGFVNIPVARKTEGGKAEVDQVVLKKNPDSDKEESINIFKLGTGKYTVNIKLRGDNVDETGSLTNYFFSVQNGELVKSEKKAEISQSVDSLESPKTTKSSNEFTDEDVTKMNKLFASLIGHGE